uniref:Vezatin n=1 Tax=Lepeophtheirus salmonis TaxID=72036 RepID=A0A0K2TV03_LEPSM
MKECIMSCLPPLESPSSSHVKEETQVLCADIAHKILESSLLVVEDEDFITNYVLSSIESEKALTTTISKGGRSLGEVLFYSCSIAAVAGTLLLLSDRTKMTAATIATLVPAGIAALANGPVLFQRPKPSEQFLQVLSDLLEDMKLFKNLARKTLNLLKGMELLQTGAKLPSINSSHGGMDTTLNSSCTTSFPALRSAAYNCTVDLIRAYRGAVRTLLEVSPLADHIDYEDHYIAFVELEKFKINEASLPSINSLKDAVQLALIQQSEYLRRFSLTFCEKAREDKKLSKAGVLKHIHDLALTIKKINKKLSNVFEYHQAMGILEDKTKLNLNLRKPNSLDLVPLKSIYTSLFSSGLHLQNSLLKVRELEKIFESIKFKKNNKKSIKHEEPFDLIPNEDQLIIWLNGFQDIQKELEACVGCLDDGASQVTGIQNKKKGNDSSHTFPQEPKNKESEDTKNPPIIDDTPIEHIDEVFEAVIDANAEEEEGKSNEDPATLLTDEELRRRKRESRVLEELKSVLCHRSVIQERREAEALAKKKGLISPEMNDHEIEKAIASQICSSDVKNLKSPVNIPSADIQEKIIKRELAKVMEEICDIEEEIIKTDLGKSIQTISSRSEDPCEDATFFEESPIASSNECHSSSSDTDCSSTCSRDTIKSIRKKRLSPLSHLENVNESNRQEFKNLNGIESSSPEEQVDSEVSNGLKSLSECLRSLSTPDLKSVSEDLTKYRRIESLNNVIETVPDNDSDPGSADEMENRVLKVYKRPLRPAALKKRKGKVQQGAKGTTGPSSCRNTHGTSSLSSVGSSSYLSKQKLEDLVIPSGPPSASVLGTSTDSFVTQIRAKANAFKVALQESEKVFGSQ